MRRITFAIAMMSAVPGQTEGQAGPAPAALDHIILATGSLARGMAAFTRLTGVTPVVGGQHPGRGTQNALASLGAGQYLEVLAPISDSGPPEPLRPMGWAIRTSDLAALRARLERDGIRTTAPVPGSRRKPDGALLTWATAGVEGAASPFMPFFIEWGKDVPHPSATSPSGCSLQQFVITEPDATLLRRVLAAAGVPVIVETGARREAALTLDCPHGRITFST